MNHLMTWWPFLEITKRKWRNDSTEFNAGRPGSTRIGSCIFQSIRRNILTMQLFIFSSTHPILTLLSNALKRHTLMISFRWLTFPEFFILIWGHKFPKLIKTWKIALTETDCCCGDWTEAMYELLTRWILYSDLYIISVHFRFSRHIYCSYFFIRTFSTFELSDMYIYFLLTHLYQLFISPSLTKANSRIFQFRIIQKWRNVNNVSAITL